MADGMTKYGVACQGTHDHTRMAGGLEKTASGDYFCPYCGKQFDKHGKEVHPQESR